MKLPRLNKMRPSSLAGHDLRIKKSAMKNMKIFKGSSSLIEEDSVQTLDDNGEAPEN
jgi:hypothetical protein